MLVKSIFHQTLSLHMTVRLHTKAVWLGFQHWMNIAESYTQVNNKCCNLILAEKSKVKKKQDYFHN